MEIIAEVDEDEIIRVAFGEFIRKLPSKSSVVIFREIFKHGDKFMRDNVGLAINRYGDKRFVKLLEEAIENEEISRLKENLQQVLDELEE